MSGPTPGPWKAIQLGGDGGIRHVWVMDPDGGEQIASTFPVSGSLDAHEANAQLIAAAPDLLAGAKAAMAACRAHLNADRESIPIEEVGLIYDVGDALRDAIAKAEGETE